MSTYIFQSDSDRAEVSLTKAEGKLYGVVCESPDWERPLFGVPKKGITYRRTRDDLLARADRLIAALEPQAALLRFIYALDQFPTDTGRWHLRGEPISVDFGPGYCRLYTTELAQAPGSSASVVITHSVADLRDLQPVVLDDGREIRAVRRAGKHDLLGKIRPLKRFLDSVEPSSFIDCSVEYRYGAG